MPISISKLRYGLYMVLCVMWIFCACYTAMVLIRKSKMKHIGDELQHSAKNVVKKKLSCFIITMNKSLESVKMHSNVTCHPFPGQSVNALIFSHVDKQVQSDLRQGISTRGAHFSNNNSVSMGTA